MESNSIASSTNHTLLESSLKWQQCLDIFIRNPTTPIYTTDFPILNIDENEFAEILYAREKNAYINWRVQWSKWGSRQVQMLEKQRKRSAITSSIATIIASSWLQSLLLCTCSRCALDLEMSTLNHYLLNSEVEGGLIHLLYIYWACEGSDMCWTLLKAHFPFSFIRNKGPFEIVVTNFCSLLILLILLNFIQIL